MMFVYKYDAITNEYIEPMTAMVDKVASRKAGKQIYFIPAFATLVEPPKTKAGEIAVFSNGKWQVEEDHRGETVYSLDTREAQTWSKIGKLPRGIVTKLTERLEDVKTLYLQTMKTNFDVYLKSNKMQIPSTELYFSYESVERLKNERDLAIQMSRDDNNKIYSLTRQEYDAIINYMVIYGQYLYLQKWIVESIIKKCNDIEILKTHKDKLDFKVNPKQINNLVKMTPEKRQEYFTQMANNIK